MKVFLISSWAGITAMWDQLIFAGGCLMNPWMLKYFKPTKEEEKK